MSNTNSIVSHILEKVKVIEIEKVAPPDHQPPIDEINRLSKELKQSRHQIMQLEKETAKMNEQHQVEHEELLLFREYVHQLENDEKQDTEDASLIALPYRSKKRIICLGGTEPWQNKMRELLPTVQFCKPDVKTNPATFRCADIIWIHRTGLLHKESFPVTNLAKKHHIPIQFFTCISAEKCAEQLAKYELKIG